MYKTTNLQINELYTFYIIKIYIIKCLNDCKTIKKTVRGRKCPVKMLLLTLIYKKMY